MTACWPQKTLSTSVCLNGLGKAIFKRMVWDWAISKLLLGVITSGDHLCASSSCMEEVTLRVYPHGTKILGVYWEDLSSVELCQGPAFS